MKAKITKKLLGIITILCLLFNSEKSFAQWVQPLTATYGDMGTLKVTSSGGSVAGNNAYSGRVYAGTDDIIQAANNGQIGSTFNSIAPGGRFKATAGKPVTISLEFNLNVFFPWLSSTITNTVALPGGIGKKEQNYAYDAYIRIPFTELINSGQKTYKYQGTYTFTEGILLKSWFNCD